MKHSSTTTHTYTHVYVKIPSPRGSRRRRRNIFISFKRKTKTVWIFPKLVRNFVSYVVYPLCFRGITVKVYVPCDVLSRECLQLRDWISARLVMSSKTRFQIWKFPFFFGVFPQNLEKRTLMLFYISTNISRGCLLLQRFEKVIHLITQEESGGGQKVIRCFHLICPHIGITKTYRAAEWCLLTTAAPSSRQEQQHKYTNEEIFALKEPLERERKLL